MPANDPVLEEMDLEEEFDLESEGSPQATTKRPQPAGKPGTPARTAKKPAPAKEGKTGKKKGAQGTSGSPKGRRPPLRRPPPPPKKPKPKFRVEIPDLEREIFIEEGTDLRTGLRANHVNLFWGPWAQAFNCRGVATCTLCKIEVLDGAAHLSARTKKEERRLKGKPESWRLACHAKIQGNITIEPFPRIAIEDKVSEEAVRRARLTPEDRERIIEERETKRKADWDAKKAAGPEPKEKKPGLIAKLVGKVKGENKGDKPKKAKPPKAVKQPKSADKGITAAPSASNDKDAAPGTDAKPEPKKGKFGLKGRK